MKPNFLFEKINKIDKLLARWIRKKRKEETNTSIRSEASDITADFTDIKKL